MTDDLEFVCPECKSPIKHMAGMTMGEVLSLRHNSQHQVVKIDVLKMEVSAKEARIAELEHQLKVECDTYLWNRKLMSRRIASLQGWMKKLFKYGSSSEAIRNQMTMTTEIPDTLMREGEDILIEITPALENGKE
jgi:hypothetical protein